MKLETLTREQAQEAREWRNKELHFLRTPYLITEKMQDEFFDNVINNRDSKHRYFAIIEEYTMTVEESVESGKTGVFSPNTIYQRFVGMAGLTNIEWENGTAEISLIINPEHRGRGYGKKAVDLLLDEAFKNMRLWSVSGEVYACGNVGFWEKIIKKYKAHRAVLIDRKYYKQTMYGSVWFSITMEMMDELIKGGKCDT
jgi:RimJ/RimL family protein N-acetyltransferase